MTAFLGHWEMRTPGYTGKGYALGRGRFRAVLTAEGAAFGANPVGALI